MKEHAFRLKKDDDLKNSIEKYAAVKSIKAGVIVSAVGCLYKTVIRNASGTQVNTLDKNVEIVSITGTISNDGCHIHISVSDEELNTYGGHLKDGCLVNTTAEIVILELDNYSFSRETDIETGYKELKVNKNN